MGQMTIYRTVSRLGEWMEEGGYVKCPKCGVYAVKNGKRHTEYCSNNQRYRCTSDTCGTIFLGTKKYDEVKIYDIWISEGRPELTKKFASRFNITLPTLKNIIGSQKLKDEPWLERREERLKEGYERSLAAIDLSAARTVEKQKQEQELKVAYRKQIEEEIISLRKEAKRKQEEFEKKILSGDIDLDDDLLSFMKEINGIVIGVKANDENEAQKKPKKRTHMPLSFNYGSNDK